MQIKGVKILNRFRINGIVLYPFILYSSRTPDQQVINHEMIHWLQIKRHGVLKFYFRYCKEYFSNRRAGMKHHEAYMKISFEQEAYQNQHKGPDFRLS